MTTKQTSSRPLTLARRLKLSLLSLVLFSIILGAMFWSSQLQKTTITSTSKPSVQPTNHDTQTTNDSIFYSGKKGLDALTLLKENASIRQDNSGLVTSINNRRADSSKREFWAFFINGKEAQVGPAEYVTKGGDQIEWKIQTY